MLAPISNSRKDGGSSFRKLQQYIVTEKDPVTGREKYRGDYLLSDSLISLSTAHVEMKAVAAQNPRVKDPVYHFQICWMEDEQPTRAQWKAAVRRSVEALGFAEHLYLAAAHENTENFHVHVMVNRVHPEHCTAHSPFWDMATLDKVMREIEHEQGWRESRGFYRWNKELGIAVQNTAAEMAEMRNERTDCVRGGAAKIEHHADVESFQSYARNVAAKELKELLGQPGTSWVDLHNLLASKRLRIERGEKGGYTVLSAEQEMRAKASDVFRESFAGKVNRRALEEKLGAWQAPPAFTGERESVYRQAPKAPREPQRDPQRRAEQRAKREEDRQQLRAEFRRYRAERREIQKQCTAGVREKRVQLSAFLKERKQAIRAQNNSWPERRAALSMATAETVIGQRLLAVRAKRERFTLGPGTYQQWVSAKAVEGDKRAIAQLRGWRYQDQRNIRKIEQELQTGSRSCVHIMGADPTDLAAWERLRHAEVRAMQHAEAIARQIAGMRMAINRQTGDVTYLLKGVTALVDRGKAITVMSKEEAATVLALEMAVKKYGHRLTAEGSEEWRDQIARTAARHGVWVEFTDPGMQRAMLEEKGRLQVRSATQAWTQTTGGVDGLTKAARVTAQRDYAQWAERNPKAAECISLSEFVEHGQRPRAVAMRAQAERWMQMRDSMFLAEARLEFRSNEEAREFLQGLYGPHGAGVFDSCLKATPPGSATETNIRQLCVLTVATSSDGRHTCHIRPADDTKARKQTEEIAELLQNSANEMRRKSITPLLKTSPEAGRQDRTRGGVER